jgi:hypothetical protein
MRKQNMMRTLKAVMVAVFCAVASGMAQAQAPDSAILDIEWENSVAYFDDVTDTSRLVTSPGPLTTTLRNFMQLVVIADIVSVNGKPARGSLIFATRLIQALPNPSPGQAIGDLGRFSVGDLHVEILQSDGTRIGAIMSSGFGGGPAPPGWPAGVSTFAVVGGSGAFFGARGTLHYPPGTPGSRNTSMQEDPGMRRAHGGTRGHIIVTLIPMFRPEIVSDASGPAVFHADFSPVSSSRPARAGETLIVRATGLGPTRPGLPAGNAFPPDPLQEVNSPVEVTVNGNAAEVLNKIGWPGTSDTYRVDIRVPDGTAPGIARVQVSAAFIPGREVSLPVQ